MKLSKLHEILDILARNDVDGYVVAEHDEIYFPGKKEQFSDGDLNQLETLGCFWDSCGSLKHYT